MATLVNQDSAAPTNKMTAVAVAGALQTVLFYVLNDLVGWDVPETVQVSFILLVTFAAGYFVKNNAVTGPVE